MALIVNQGFVEAGRVGGGADIDGHIVVLVGLGLRGGPLLAGNHDQRLFGLLGRRPDQIHQHRVAELDPAAFNGLVAGGALAEV
jgi:hypothetical protein